MNVTFGEDLCRVIRAFGLAKVDLFGSHSGTLNLLERGVRSNVRIADDPSRMSPESMA